MRSRGLEIFFIWLLLFVFFGPMVAQMTVESVDQIVATLAPYLGMAGMALLVFLALRMLFSRY